MRVMYDTSVLPHNKLPSDSVAYRSDDLLFLMILWVDWEIL